jgi:hypothetical protein
MPWLLGLVTIVLIVWAVSYLFLNAESPSPQQQQPLAVNAAAQQLSPAIDGGPDLCHPRGDP